MALNFPVEWETTSWGAESHVGTRDLKHEEVWGGHYMEQLSHYRNKAGLASHVKSSSRAHDEEITAVSIC